MQKEWLPVFIAWNEIFSIWIDVVSLFVCLFQESVDAEGPVVEKIMSSRSVKKQVSTIWSDQNVWCM